MGSKAFPVVVTSYEIVIADSKHLARYTWKYVVVDEGHRLKNFNCKLLRELRTIPTNNKLLLSGECKCIDPLIYNTASALVDHTIGRLFGPHSPR